MAEQRRDRDRAGVTDGMPSTTTLAGLARRRIDIWLWCRACSHHAVVNSTTLADRLGQDFPVSQVGRQARCSRCGARDGDARPNWPSIGVTTSHRHD